MYFSPSPRLYRTAINSQGMYTVTLIPGDGIGPEIADSVKAVFEAAKVLHLPDTDGGDGRD